MQALGSLAFAHSAFEKTGEDLKEGASYDQVSEEFQDATEKVNEVQRVEEIAQEQLCNSRERHDADVLEMLIVKDANVLQILRKNKSMTVGIVTTKIDRSYREPGWTQRRPNDVRKVHMRKSKTIEGVIDACQRCTRLPNNV